MGNSPSNVKNNLVANNVQINDDKNKTTNAIKDAQDKEMNAKLAIQRENQLKEKVEKLKKDIAQAYLIAEQVGIATPDVKQKIMDNIISLTEQIKLADFETAKATEEKIKAIKMAEIAVQQAKMAQELNTMNMQINKMPKHKRRFVNKFPLQCPNGFVKQGNFCGHFVDVPDNGVQQLPNNGVQQLPDNGVQQLPDNGVQQLPDNAIQQTPQDITKILQGNIVETFENIKETNSTIILIIFILIGILVYRNKDKIKL